MRKVLFIISVILFILFLRLAIKGVGNVNIPLLDNTDTVEMPETQKLFSFFSSNGIDPQTHVCFQGTTLNGLLSDVVYKFENKGYKLVREGLNTATLKGKILGRPNSYVILESCPVCLEVYCLTGCLPAVAHWSEVYNDYLYVKGILTDKHGNPRRSIERFSYPVSLKDEQQCEYALKNGECEYLTIFDIEGGHIELSIHSSKKNKAKPFSIYIRYIDDENYEDRDNCLGGHQ